jgi:predicted  nucleic acid-binding Zn-ribbon protein
MTLMNATLSQYPPQSRLEPIGSDWPQAPELAATDEAIVALKAASGDHPMALALLQEKRAKLADWLRRELDEIRGRHEGANNDLASKLKQVTPIAELEQRIAEANTEAERLERIIAGFDAHAHFQSTWTGEPQRLHDLRNSIEVWRKAIADRPRLVANHQPRPIPSFFTIPEAF